MLDEDCSGPFLRVMKNSCSMLYYERVFLKYLNKLRFVEREICYILA